MLPTAPTSSCFYLQASFHAKYPYQRRQRMTVAVGWFKLFFLFWFCFSFYFIFIFISIPLFALQLFFIVPVLDNASAVPAQTDYFQLIFLFKTVSKRATWLLSALVAINCSLNSGDPRTIFELTSWVVRQSVASLVSLFVFYFFFWWTGTLKAIYLSIVFNLIVYQFYCGCTIDIYVHRAFNKLFLFEI